jgi:hypothetical protein
MPHATCHSLFASHRISWKVAFSKNYLLKQGKQVDDLRFEIFRAVTMNNAVFPDVDVSEQHVASIFRVE